MLLFIKNSFYHRGIKYLLSLLVAFAFSSFANAGSFYTALNVMRLSVDVAGIEFNPVLSKIKLGYSFTPQIMFELQVSGSGTNQSDNSTVEISELRAAYLRLASNPDREFRIHVLLGYAETSLQLSGISTISDNYGGYSWGVILENRIWSDSNFLTLGYNNFYYNDNVEISAVNLGYKYIF